jgi:methionyl-tRNA formyltransferase
MNIVFFGSAGFAVPSLKALAESGHKVCCVVTQPDRKKGRGLDWKATSVKLAAQELKYQVYTTENINSQETAEFLKHFNADLFIVIAFGQIFSPEILNIPRIFSMNIHASLLPKYRGAAPINWAIINGEKETGVTVIKLTQEMDAGPIILQKKVNIDYDDTAVTLSDKLSRLAADALLDSVKAIENNSFNLTVQDKNGISFARKLKKQNGLINWEKSAEDIYNLVRGCFGWPGAFTYYRGKLLKVYKASVAKITSLASGKPIGQVMDISALGVTILTGQGALTIEEIQLEGKKRMPVSEFIKGSKIDAGEILGEKKSDQS